MFRYIIIQNLLYQLDLVLRNFDYSNKNFFKNILCMEMTTCFAERLSYMSLKTTSKEDVGLNIVGFVRLFE